VSSLAPFCFAKVDQEKGKGEERGNVCENDAENAQ